MSSRLVIRYVNSRLLRVDDRYIRMTYVSRLRRISIRREIRNFWRFSGYLVTAAPERRKATSSRQETKLQQIIDALSA